MEWSQEAQGTGWRGNKHTNLQEAECGCPGLGEQQLILRALATEALTRNETPPSQQDAVTTRSTVETRPGATTTGLSQDDFYIDWSITYSSGVPADCRNVCLLGTLSLIGSHDTPSFWSLVRYFSWF